MPSAVDPLPEGVHTLTPRLFVRGPAEALQFYRLAFGAAELGRHADPSGKVVSAEMKVGDSLLSLAEESPQWGNHSPQSLGGVTAVLTLNVEDADAVWEQALSAGAEVVFPLADQFYGYRQGRLKDPFGHCWIVSTRIEAIPPEELKRRVEAQAS
jgi:PhnB protein